MSQNEKPSGGPKPRSSGNVIDEILDHHPAMGCLGLIALVWFVGAVVPSLAQQVVIPTPLGLAGIAAAILGAYLYEQRNRERRRTAAMKGVEQLKQEHPELVAVIDILDTYRAISDEAASTSATFQSVLFFALGIATPIFFGKLHAF